ncbi:MAG: M50 family metallopeptidase [Clostridia bacterium]|nr:M50 family metallopeptidase [Clostridia bacterium]
MRICRISDIDIHISKYLLLLVVILLITGHSDNLPAAFFILCLHEMSHVLAARLLKLKVSEIELLPFGGAVRIQSLFELNPVHEILVSVAGPLSNVLLLLFYFGGVQLKWLTPFSQDSDFVNINLMLAGFNLLPALPLDGGRMLRAILARQMGIQRATRIANGMGLLLALILTTAGLYGLYYRVVNYSLFILSGFLIYSVIQEKRNATYVMLKDITYKKEALLKEGSLPIRNIAVISNLALKDVVKKFIPQRYHYIQVMDEQLKELGTLNESEIVNGLLDHGTQISVGRLLRL